MIPNTAQSFRQFFEAPRLGDETTYRRAYLLSFLVNLYLIIAITVFLLFGTVAFVNHTLPIIALLSCIPVLIIRLLIRQNRIQTATYIFLGLITVLVPLATFISKGSVGTVSVTGFQFIAIIMSGLLLEEFEVFIFVVITLLINGTLLYAESHTLYEIQTFIRSPLSLWFTQTIAYSAGATLTWMANKLIKDSFKRANSELHERGQAEQREQSYRELLEKVIHIGKTVTEAADFKTTLLRIWDGVHNVLDFDRVGIFIYLQDEDALQGTYGTDRSGQLSEEWDLKVKVSENPFFKQTLSRPDGYFFTDDYEGTNDLPPGHRMAGVKYNAAVACWSGDKPVAFISVDQMITGRPITKEKLEALRLFAGYAGPAIESIRLNERERDRHRMLEKVIHLGKAVTEAADFQTTLKRIWDGVRNGLDFDRVGIFLYVPEQNAMLGSYGTDNAGQITEEWHVEFPLDRGSFFDTVVSRPDGYYFTNDYENAIAEHSEIMKGVKYNAAVACWSGDKPVAIISVDNVVTNRPITEEQLEALRLFAGYAGLAIQNSRLNTELERGIRERELFIDELGMKNAELERFTYTVSHELKSPIVTIKNFLGLIDSDLHRKNYESAQRDFQRIVKATNKMQDTLSDLLELSRIGRIVNPYEPIDLVKLIHEALETVHGRIDNRHIMVKVAPQFPPAYGDHVRLREVFENLIDNAAKYIGVQETPFIEIGFRDGEEPVFYVKDNGMGIDPQYHTRVFGLFDKLDPSSDGTGVGLALIKRIIEVHGGRIWVESEGLGKGSTFCFTIPQKA